MKLPLLHQHLQCFVVVVVVVVLTVIPQLCAKPLQERTDNHDDVGPPHHQQSDSSYVLKFQQAAEKLQQGSVYGNKSLETSSNGPVMTCDYCETILFLVYLAWKTGSEEGLTKVIVDICSEYENEQVCHGVAQLFKDELFTTYGNTKLSHKQLCGLVLAQNCAPDNPANSWNISLPNTKKPPVSPHFLPQAGSPTVRVLHLTDIHLDTLYSPNTTADCGEPLCCRASNGKAAPYPNGSGLYGDYRDCDTPVWTLISLFENVNKQKFDYILWTGDLPAHNVWNQSRTDQTDLLFRITKLLDKYFPGKPIYPALGNHESSPVDSFPPRYVPGNRSISWLYDALADTWKHWLPAEALGTVRKGAYYTISPYPGFRIISINTNYCNNMNWWLFLNVTDPDGQLAWLINTLQKAENAKEKVHIIGHIPPGISDCLIGWSHNYYKIVDRYESTITGQFFGHTHFDHFEVFYDLETLKRPTNVAYISPSVTPYSNLNMGYRIFSVDGNYANSSWAVLDHETYVLNLESANLRNTSVWDQEYVAKAQYGMKSLFPQDWDDLLTKMETDDTLFNLYYQYYLKSHVVDKCDSKCKEQMLCEARSARSGSSADFCGKHVRLAKRKTMC